MRKRAVFWVLVGLPAGLLVVVSAGCQGVVNDRLVLAGSGVLPSLSPSSEPVGDDVSRAWSGPGEATVSIDRGGWPVQRFVVPVDGTVHGPVWGTRTILSGTDIVRREGVYPTEETALDLRGEDDFAVVREALWSYVDAAVEWGLFPLKLFLSPLWSEHQSPRVVYKRYRADDWVLSP